MDATQDDMMAEYSARQYADSLYRSESDEGWQKTYTDYLAGYKCCRRELNAAYRDSIAALDAQIEALRRRAAD